MGNKAGLDIDKTEDEKKEMEELTKDFEPVATWLKKQLGERVQKVQISDRLVDSPATLVQGEWGMSPMMQRYMKSQTTSSASDSAFAIGSRNQAIPEINPQHAVIKKLKNAMETAPEADTTEDMVVTLQSGSQSSWRAWVAALVLVLQMPRSWQPSQGCLELALPALPLLSSAVPCLCVVSPTAILKATASARAVSSVIQLLWRSDQK